MKRILVVGGGLIGIRHLQAVQAHAECELVGLVDLDMSIQCDVARFAKMGDVLEQMSYIRHHAFCVGRVRVVGASLQLCSSD